MSHLEYACPVCHTTVMRSREPLEQSRPNEFYRCPDCWSSIHFRDLRTRNQRVDLVLGSGGGAYTFAYLPIATAVEEELAGSLDITGISVLSRATLVVGIVARHSGAEESGTPTVTWGADVATVQVENGNVASVNAYLAVLMVSSGATKTVQISFPADAPRSIAVFASQAVRLASGSLDVGGVDSGTSSTPSVTSEPTTRANELAISVIGTAGPSTDAAGTWTGGFTAGQRRGANGAALPVTISEGYRELVTTTTPTAGKTGITSRPWNTIVGAFVKG